MLGEWTMTPTNFTKLHSAVNKASTSRTKGGAMTRLRANETLDAPSGRMMSKAKGMEAKAGNRTKCK